jgi:hypothetical protein
MRVKSSSRVPIGGGAQSVLIWIAADVTELDLAAAPQRVGARLSDARYVYRRSCSRVHRSSR